MQKKELKEQGRYDTGVIYASTISVRGKENRRQMFDVLENGDLQKRCDEYIFDTKKLWQ